MKFLKTSLVVLFAMVVLFSNVAIAQNVNTRPTTKTNDPNPGNSNSTHASDHPGSKPTLTFTKGLDKAREIVASKTQFKMEANTSNPFYSWGDKNYAIQNTLQINSIVEYNDNNQNQLYDKNELVKTLSFQQNVTWNFTQESVNDSFAIFTLYASSINQTGFENSQVNLTQYYSSVNNYMKFDIIISHWPWSSTNDRIGLIFNFYLSGETSHSKAVISAKHDYNEDNLTNDGLFIDNNSNQTIGYVLSSLNAKKGLNNESIAVNNQFEINHSTNTATIILNYPYFGDYLFHDPIIGSNGDTVAVFTEIYSILIAKNGLLTMTFFLSVLSLVAIFVMRRRK